MNTEQPMKIVIAPDSFKDSLTALEVAQAIRTGWARVWPDVDYVLVPMADGGEGTVQSLIDATGGSIINKKVKGPLGTSVNGFFGLLGDGQTAVIEMAAAAGLEYLSESERNPLITTSYGVGELILAAMDHGARHIILGLGGSATNDGGCGMAQALGVHLLDNEGSPLPPGGQSLSNLSAIDDREKDRRIADCRFDIATDVTNPLTGRLGASAVFAPQKGASPAEVESLDRALAHFAAIVRRDLKMDIEQVPGTGAAGGLGAGALCFLKGTIRPGIEWVIHETQLERKMGGASLVITGEGKIDSQTIYGKTPIGVAHCANKLGIPVLALAGSLAKDSSVVLEHGMDALFSIVPGACSLAQAISDAKENIERVAENLARFWQLAARSHQ